MFLCGEGRDVWKILRVMKLALHGRPYIIVKDGEVTWDVR